MKKRIVLFFVLLLAAVTADFGVFVLALTRHGGVAGLIAWSALHVCLGCWLMRLAGRAPVLPDDYDRPLFGSAHASPAADSPFSSFVTRHSSLPQ